MVHRITTLSQTSTRIIVALATIFDLNIWSHDVTLAYIQSKEELSRDVFIRPNQSDLKIPEFCQLLKDGDVLKLERPLYGLEDAGDLWHETIDRHLRDDRSLEKCKLDKSLYFKQGNEKNEPPCVIGQYVYDSIICGDSSFETLTESTLSKF